MGSAPGHRCPLRGVLPGHACCISDATLSSEPSSLIPLASPPLTPRLGPPPPRLLGPHGWSPPTGRVSSGGVSWGAASGAQGAFKDASLPPVSASPAAPTSSQNPDCRREPQGPPELLMPHPQRLPAPRPQEPLVPRPQRLPTPRPQQPSAPRPQQHPVQRERVLGRATGQHVPIPRHGLPVPRGVVLQAARPGAGAHWMRTLAATLSPVGAEGQWGHMAASVRAQARAPSREDTGRTWSDVRSQPAAGAAEKQGQARGWRAQCALCAQGDGRPAGSGWGPRGLG